MAGKKKVIKHISYEELMASKDIKQIGHGINRLWGNRALRAATSILCGVTAAYEVVIGNLGMTIAQNISNFSQLGNAISDRINNLLASSLPSILDGIGMNSQNMYNSLMHSKYLLFAGSVAVCWWSIKKFKKIGKQKKELKNHNKQVKAEKEAEREGAAATSATPTPATATPTPTPATATPTPTPATATPTPTPATATPVTPTPATATPVTPTPVIDPVAYGELLMEHAKLKADNFTLQSQVDNSISKAAHESKIAATDKSGYARGKREGERGKQAAIDTAVAEEKAKATVGMMSLAEHEAQMQGLKATNLEAINNARLDERTKATVGMISIEEHESQMEKLRNEKPSEVVFPTSDAISQAAHDQAVSEILSQIYNHKITDEGLMKAIQGVESVAYFNGLSAGKIEATPADLPSISGEGRSI